MSKLTTRVRIVHDLTEETGVCRARDHVDFGKTYFSPTRTVAMAGNADGTVSVGVAWAHPNDQFSRRRGRQAAEGRLLLGFGRETAERHFFVVDSYDALVEALTREDSVGVLIAKSDGLKHCYDLVVRDQSDLQVSS